jgi:uroporphyrinogen decarboxylase
MSNQMTPKERFQALAEGRPVDRIPHGFGLGDGASNVTGIKVSEYHLDAKKHVEADVAAYRKYGLDGLMAMKSLQTVFGVEVAYPDDSTPYVAKPVALEGDDLKKDYLGDPKKNPDLKLFWDILDGLFEAVGDEAPISVAMEGTFTLAGRTIGVEKLLKKLIRDPDYVRAVLDKISDTQIAFVESLQGYEVGFGSMDPVTSGDLIRHDVYAEFVKPYQKKLYDAFERVSGKKGMLHICGDSSKMWLDFLDVGVGAFSPDNRMDLVDVKRAVGDKVAIVGNVHPSKTMLLGTPDDVREDLRETFRKGWDAPAGFIPGFGCGLPIPTPEENLTTLFEELDEIGKFPLDPARFA